MEGSGGRLLPLERAAAAGRSGAGAALDEVDALLAAVDQRELPKPPWLKAYAALRSKRLDKLTRHFGWRLLHGSVRCGAAAVAWCPARTVDELQAAVCCPHPACAAAVPVHGGRCVPCLADFSHVFLHCPAVRPAVQWLVGLWARIAPEDEVVPLDARVILLGDGTVWAPRGGPAAEELWLHLRLLFCRAVWSHAGRSGVGVAGDRAAAAVVATAASLIARSIRLDWLRVAASLPGASVLPSWCVVDTGLPAN